MSLELVWLISLLSFLTFSYAADTLTSLDALRGNQVLVSAGGVFELGLFNESSSSYYYLGIWLRADATKIVWVARDSPLMDSSAQLRIMSGNLVLSDRRQQVQLIVNSGSLALAANTSATLLDNGNFVLKEVDTGNTIWQSFDIPSDTYLPGMKVGILGQDYRSILSWSSPLNPARGFITLIINNTTRNLSVGLVNAGYYIDISYRDGDNIRFIFENSTVNTSNFSFHSNVDEVFYTFTTGEGYDLVWFVMNYTGHLDQHFMVDGKISSVSHALCSASTDGNTRTCINSTPSDCEDGSEFSQISGLLPSTPNTSGSYDMVIPDCETFCKNNCSCTAFSSIGVGEPGCQFYYGSKHDLLKNIEKGTDFIYIRGSGPNDDKQWKLKMAVVMATLLVFVPILFTCYLCRRKRHKG